MVYVLRKAGLVDGRLTGADAGIVAEVFHRASRVAGPRSAPASLAARTGTRPRNLSNGYTYSAPGVTECPGSGSAHVFVHGTNNRIYVNQASFPA